jgi:hypothetical protein
MENPLGSFRSFISSEEAVDMDNSGLFYAHAGRWLIKIACGWLETLRGASEKDAGRESGQQPDLVNN